MAIGGPPVIPIHELVDLCDRRAAIDLGWFEMLGMWATDEPAGADQQTWAVAGHRHAWHAELWSGRRPTIPHDAEHPSPRPLPVEATGDRRTAYRSHLGHTRAELARIRAAVDATLDPATARVVDLVDADLAELQSRLDGPR